VTFVPPAIETTRVTRRELGLICRYGLVQAGLDLGHVMFGARLIAAAEIYLGSGLAWLARYVRERPTAPALQVIASNETVIIEARGGDFLVAAPAAIDLLTLGVRTRGNATVDVHNLADVSLAPVLTESATRRGLTILVQAVSAKNGPDDAAAIQPSAGWPGRSFATLDARTMPAPFGVSGSISLLASEMTHEPIDGWKAASGEGVSSLSTSAPETIDVSFDQWVDLLDLVGGTLPPDGRGRLTRTSEAAADDAGPGAGKQDDDD
jgi:hypothetical protein